LLGAEVVPGIGRMFCSARRIGRPVVPFVRPMSPGIRRGPVGPR
jgi:hypothetical protein